MKNIKLDVVWPEKSEIHVLADMDRIGQLFSNLLTNSLRYTEEGGRLEIRIMEQAGNVEIQFNDSEPGVATDDIPKLFDRLFRVESSRSRGTGGTGLGLAICKNIVDAHQGTITAGKSPYNGLQIKVELPLAR
jgi:two-component system sensor histidine kinase BaeS